MEFNKSITTNKRELKSFRQGFKATGNKITTQECLTQVRKRIKQKLQGSFWTQTCFFLGCSLTVSLTEIKDLLFQERPGPEDISGAPQKHVSQGVSGPRGST